MLRRSWVVVGQNVALLLADPAPIVVTTLMPLVLMFFLKGTSEAVLVGSGVEGANGAEQVVPGMIVLFAFFGVGFLGTAFFSEHNWGTWDRLRASAARPIEIVVGKMLPSAILMLGQMVVLFAAGVSLLDLHVRGSLTGVGVMMATATVFLIALSMLAVSFVRTANQMNAFVNMGAMVVAGIGGALAPLEVLPGWAQTIAPLSPAYWMLDGFKRVVIEPGTVGTTLVPAGVTLAFAVGAALIASRRFRMTDDKVGWEG